MFSATLASSHSNGSRRPSYESHVCFLVACVLDIIACNLVSIPWDALEGHGAEVQLSPDLDVSSAAGHRVN